MQYNLIMATVTIVYIDLSQQRQFLPPAPVGNNILKKLLYEEMPIDLREGGHPKKGKRKGKRAKHLKKTNKKQDTDTYIVQNDDSLFDKDDLTMLWNILNEDEKQKNKSETPFKYKDKQIGGPINSDTEDGSNVKVLLKRLRTIDQEKRKTEALLKNVKLNEDVKTPAQVSEPTSKEGVKTNFINELTDMIADKIVKKYHDDDDDESVEKIDILLGSDMDINVDSVLHRSTAIILV